MTIEDLLALPFSSRLTVFNEPFSLTHKYTFKLDGGDERFLMHHGDDFFLAVAPDDEEIIFFKKLDEELEPQAGMMMFGGKEYEFNYEDAGDLFELEDDTEADRYTISDYEAEDGEIMRLITNETTGDQEVYLGHRVVEDDILNVE